MHLTRRAIIPVQVTDPDGSWSRAEYDSGGSIVREVFVNADGSSGERVYDLYQNFLKVADFNADGSGRISEYTPDGTLVQSISVSERRS